MTVPLFKVFMDPTAGYHVTETLKSGYIGQGNQVETFERAFGDLIGAPEPPLSVNSCTSALDLALHLCGVGPGDEVISTPMTCTATNTGIVNRGARVVWADVDPVTGLIDPEDVGRKVTKQTVAVIGVDWAGRVAEYPAIRRSIGAAAPEVPTIQDAAHSLLAEPNDFCAQFVPWGGDYICWSFQAIKHLTTGDGGALLTPHGTYLDPMGNAMERARLLRWYGFDRRSSKSFRCEQDIEETGFKYHLNDIAATIGLANIRHMPRIVGQHRANAAYYHEALKHLEPITLPPPDPGSAWWLYCILTPERDAFIEFAKERGVEASPVHSRNDRMTAFRRACANPDTPLPGVDYFASHEVAVPVGWWLTDDDRAHVAGVVHAWARYLKVTGKVKERVA
jgi:dTDP-4-amino-4,6-dideoxygalactose transaminase